MSNRLWLITYVMTHHIHVRLADNPQKGICDSLAECTKVSFQIDKALFWLAVESKASIWNFLKTGELEAVESMVDQLADPNKFPPGRTLYDTLMGWGVGTSINTHDGVFFKAGFE